MKYDKLIKFLNKIKIRYLSKRYKKLKIDNSIRVLGNIPFFKIPMNGQINIGRNVVLNSDFKNSNTMLTGRCKFVTGYNGKIIVGQNSMFNGVCIVAYKKISIGENCQIASSTLIADTDFHPVSINERLKQVSGLSYDTSSVKEKEIVIGNNVWVGWNATILKGVTIGDNSIVAAGSVVLTGVYPSNSIIAGNPAKVIKNI